jgi:hypothetical protein
MIQSLDIGVLTYQHDRGKGGRGGWRNVKALIHPLLS